MWERAEVYVRDDMVARLQAAAAIMNSLGRANLLAVHTGCLKGVSEISEICRGLFIITSHLDSSSFIRDRKCCSVLDLERRMGVLRSYAVKIPRMGFSKGRRPLSSTHGHEQPVVCHDAD